MADRLGWILDLHSIAPSFDHFPSLNAPAPAPLASTHCRHVSVWSNLPYVASTGTIFERDEIESFAGVVALVAMAPSTTSCWCRRCPPVALVGRLSVILDRACLGSEA